MSETRASKKPKTSILKGFEGLAGLVDKQSSHSESISQGQENKESSIKTSRTPTVHTLRN